jgi:hypothetical protein
MRKVMIFAGMQVTFMDAHRGSIMSHVHENAGTAGNTAHNS